jgi:hypothetical protein
VIIFDDEYHMYVLNNQASAEAWWEMPEEFACGFDALARPLSMAGKPHRVRLELAGEPDEAELRRLVANHYRRHLRGQTPPQAPALSDFVAALPREGL